jgi:hypothetical protein
MKLVGRQFRGFQSAESGTRHRGRSRGQAEALFSSGPAAITRCAWSPCPPPFLHMSEHAHFSDAHNQFMFSHMRMQQCSTCASSLHFYLTSSRHRVLDWIVGLERERAMRAATMNEWWHDEMAHRPSGECGERNLPCVSAVSPITALGS